MTYPCPRCSQMLPPTAVFCRRCGMALPPLVGGPIVTAGNKRTNILTPVLTLLLIGTVAVASLVFVGTESHPTAEVRVPAAFLPSVPSYPPQVVYQQQPIRMPVPVYVPVPQGHSFHPSPIYPDSPRRR